MEDVKEIIKWGWKGIDKVFKITRFIFLIVSVYVIVISLFFYFAKKEQNEYFNNNNFRLLEKKIYNDFFSVYDNTPKKERQFLEIFRALNCLTIGNLCTRDPSESFEYFRESILGKVSYLIVLPYTAPPASGIAWTTDSLANLGIIPKAVAAPLGGIGTNAISPFYPIWSLFRNIAYLVVVLILITIGFLIMLKTKVNPQTVIGIENSLPKIIASLILITFSFPIAGFLIDFMYILILLIIFLLYPTNSTFALQKANKFLAGGYFAWTSLFQPINYKPFRLGWPPFKPSIYLVAQELTLILPPILSDFLNVLGWFLTFFMIKGGAKFIIQSIKKLFNGGKIELSPLGAALQAGGIGAVVSFVGTVAADIGSFTLADKIISAISLVTILIYISILLSIVFTVFRLFFLLLFSYIRILLNILLSPFYMLLESLPGQSGASRWIKAMLIELLTFPLVVLFLILASLIMEQPLTENVTPWAPPFLYGIRADSIKMLAGLGIFLMSPGLIKQIKKSLGAQKPLIDLNFRTFLFGGGALLGGIVGGLQTTRSYISLIPNAENYLRSLGGIGKWLAGPNFAEEVAQAMKSMSTPPDDAQKQEGKK